MILQTRKTFYIGFDKKLAEQAKIENDCKSLQQNTQLLRF
jgi:hypothetical protein